MTTNTYIRVVSLVEIMLVFDGRKEDGLLVRVCVSGPEELKPCPMNGTKIPQKPKSHLVFSDSPYGILKRPKTMR